MASKPKDLDRCERLSLSVPTKRRLWSESGGYCQNPTCAEFVFTDGDIDFAEMAHIVAATTGGARDVSKVELSEEERADHTNIAVLCVRCHTIIDKGPDRYPIDMLKRWKARHQDKLKQAFGTPEYVTRAQAHAHLEPLLAQSAQIFQTYGPRVDDPSEDRAELWRRHALETVVPNNAEIVRVLKQNRDLLSAEERLVADAFELHASEFTARHVLGDWAAGSQRFPAGMASILEWEL